MFVKNIYTKNVFIKFEPFFDFFSQPNLALLFKNSLYCLVYMLDVVLFIIIEQVQFCWLIPKYSQLSA